MAETQNHKFHAQYMYGHYKMVTIFFIVFINTFGSNKIEIRIDFHFTLSNNGNLLP